MKEGLIIRAAHYPGRAPIDAYGNGGFRFADMSHRGSILCLPSGIHGWPVTSGRGLTEEDLEKVIAEAGELDILLVGTGIDLVPLSKTVRERLRQFNVSVEPMSTGSAVRTYNVLLAEDRAVGAALIAVE
ncbi:Mth938-like domain-containing protein [Aquamicrobium zhengzhouense]|uniref:Mth938-like domain-containing protein n=1 Tax=Aquamicrobium zhengzhouense TaxID=2781738 RepID=A0ABS0SB01_9HYPH|nr:Mth938-like domain-containing protein [Aquamicrobium zhengzhouense]MBI1620473.1 Mth938-like domain-containing protein [Aquamicrobium zhengzhouense]